MKLIDQPTKWHRFWSMRFAILAAVFGALELALPLWQDVIPQTTFATLSTLCAAAAAISRVIKQEALND